MGAMMRAHERGVPPMPKGDARIQSDGRSAATDLRPPEPLPRTTSAELLRGARRLLIEHDGETYTLHLTRQNKLLLTK